MVWFESIQTKPNRFEAEGLDVRRGTRRTRAPQDGKRGVGRHSGSYILCAAGRSRADSRERQAAEEEWAKWPRQTSGKCSRRRPSSMSSSCTTPPPEWAILPVQIVPRVCRVHLTGGRKLASAGWERCSVPVDAAGVAGRCRMVKVPLLLAHGRHSAKCGSVRFRYCWGYV